MRKFLKSVVIAPAVLALASCSWKVPEAIAIKTNAEYSFALGTYSKSLAEELSIDKISENITDQSKDIPINLYDYKPVDNPADGDKISQTGMNFLAELNVKDIDLNMSNLLPENLDLEGNLGESISSPIEIPEVEIPNLNEYMQKEMEIELPDFSSQILDNISFSVPDARVPDNPSFNGTLDENNPASQFIEDLDIDVGLGDENNNVDSIYFSKGCLNLTCIPKENIPDGFELKLAVTLKSKNPTTGVFETVAATDSPVAIPNNMGEQVVIPLALSEEHPLSTHLKIFFTGSTLTSSKDESDPSSIFSTDNYYYTIGVDFSDDARISKVTGVTMDLGEQSKIQLTDDQGNPYKIDAVENDMFVRCKIGEGALYLRCAEPDGWSGFTFTPTIEVTGGVTATSSDFVEIPSDDEKYISNAILSRKLVLDGKAYSKGEITINGYIDVALENATIVFSETTQVITVKVEGDVKSIDEVVCDLKSVLYDAEKGESKLTYKTEYDLDSGDTKVSDYVEYIELKNYGVRIPYKNSFPSDLAENAPEGTKSSINQINVKYWSKFLGFGDEEHPVDGTIYSWGNKKTTVTNAEGNEEETNYIDRLSLINNDEGGIKIYPAVNHVVDFGITMILPGRQQIVTDFGTDPAYDYYAILKGIEPGATYHLEVLSPETELNWTEAGIKTSALGETLTNTVDTGFDMSTIFSSMSDALGEQNFVKNLEITSLPIYLYCILPDLEELNSFGFGGTIVAKTINAETSEVTSSSLLLGEEVDNEDGTTSINAKSMVTMNELPVLDTEANLQKKLVTQALKKKPYSIRADLAEIFNRHAEGTVNLDYNITLGDGTKEYFTVTKAQFDQLKEKAGSEDSVTKISIVARMILPLSLKIVPNEGKDAVTIDIMSLINEGKESTEDLFQRDEGTSLDDIEKFVDLLEYASIDYTLGNKIFKYSNSDGLKIRMNPKIDGIEPYELKFGKDTLKVETEDFKKMLQTFPFTPDLEVVLPGGEVEILREPSLDVGAAIHVKTNGTYQIFGKDKATAGGN